MKASCIILTMGDRPDELARAMRSAVEQTDVDLEVLVVANGADLPVEAPAHARVLRLDENLGAPGGRNRGIEATTGDPIFFLDDDSAFSSERFVADACRRFADDPSLGIATFRVVDPDGGPAQRRHVPRLRASHPERSSDVTTILEGACAIRREVFARAGVYAADFRFGHEGTDLAWRALDAGYRVRYVADLVIHHPATPPTRHRDFHYLTARNRVLLARRRLPWSLAWVYCLTWLVLGLARAGSRAAVRDQLRGFADGIRLPRGERRPIAWRTVWRMTKSGRPPIV